MRTYDQEYYFIRSASNDSHPTLTPDKNTEDRRFRFEAQPFGSPPLVFFNGAMEYQKKLHISVIENPPEILFDGADMLVPNRIRKELLALDIQNLYMHPAVYIHDDGKWFEHYWYLTFTDRFDCWDRNTSTYDQEEPPIRLGGFELHQVYTYSFNKELLDKTPLEQRLLFNIGGALDAFTVCHENILSLFNAGDKSGTKLTLISDY
jgi:hypothetical protein